MYDDNSTIIIYSEIYNNNDQYQFQQVTNSIFLEVEILNFIIISLKLFELFVRDFLTEQFQGNWLVTIHENNTSILRYLCC